MSEAHDGEGRRRKSHRSLRALWMWGVPGVIVLLLLVNLAMSLPAMIRGETPGGFLADAFSRERLSHIGLWVALLPAAGACVLGFRWAQEAYARSERPTALWMRRAFVVSLTAWIALLIVIMDVDAFPSRTSIVISAAALFSLSMIPFAIAARAASDGRYGGRGPSDGSGGGGGGKQRRRRRRSSSGDAEERDA